MRIMMMMLMIMVAMMMELMLTVLSSLFSISCCWCADERSPRRHV